MGDTVTLTDDELVTIGDKWATPSSLKDLVDSVEAIVAARMAEAWDNGVDTAGQYAANPVVVDDECKPLNPYRDGGTA